MWASVRLIYKLITVVKAIWPMLTKLISKYKLRKGFEKAIDDKDVSLLESQLNGGMRTPASKKPESEDIR